jgi:hypothetical protein
MKEKCNEEQIEKNIEKSLENCCTRGHKHHHGHSGGGDGVYFFGFVGAAIFFIGQATTFWTGVLGFLKAIIWPVYFVYEGLKFLIK